MSNVPKFDIFSDPQVPIDMACFARQRVYRLEVVRLRTALTDLANAKQELDDAEEGLRHAEKEVARRVEELNEYMKKTGER